MKLAHEFVERLRALSLWMKVWWGSGLVFLLGVAITDSGSCLGVLFTFFFVLWAVPTVLWGLYWLWVKATYRISVRLFFSYLLVGVLPFPLILGLLAFAGYILIGQYASAEFGDVVVRMRGEMVRLTEEALAAADAGGTEAARARFSRGPDLAVDLEVMADHVDWLFASNGDVWYGDGAPRIKVPDWATEGVESGPFWYGDTQWLVAVGRRGEHTAVAFIRLTDEVAKAVSRDNWFKVTFIEDDDVNVADDEGFDDAEAGSEDGQAGSEDGEAGSEDGEAGSEDGQAGSEDGQAGSEDGQAGSGEEPGGSVESGKDGASGEQEGGDGFWNAAWTGRWIWFVRIGPDLRRWSSGAEIQGKNFATLINTSPREAATDLFRAHYEVREVLWQVFLGMSLFFLAVYGAAVTLAAYHIWAITRSTARLTNGTRQVQSGRLDYRIPVKRRDQLGDLAVAFNQMTESVGSMLEAVAEKERLKSELQLAREIQQSLLPGTELRHGPIVVHAYFRPAAEVGGDYFDLFPLERGRLIVAVGDVAGHGLSTGLLMAMVKSAVATLVQDGHRGPEILERVNQLMLRQPRERRMVTLAIAEIDTEAGVADVTNAAHPPVYLSGGTVREVMLPALPIGYRWRNRPPTERLALEAGSRLVFYSDGLVEAVDPEGEQFGYERLREFLQVHAELGSEELLALLLKDLEGHTLGRPLDDDLTVLVIDCGPSGTSEDEGSGQGP